MKKETIVKVALIIALIIIVMIAIILIKKTDTVMIQDGHFYQYYFGVRNEYIGKIYLNREEGISKITIENKDVTLDSTPLYYSEEPNKLILPKDMMMVTLDETIKLSKITHFSIISQDKNLMTTVEKRDKKTNINNGFIYDGKDLYFFLESETLKINGKEYKISPLSYVKVKYQEFIEIYNYDENQNIVIQDQEAVNKDVILESRYYTLNLSTDSIKYGMKEQLLISNIENLPALQ